jgi:enediyne biosynthesis protein E4
VMAGGSFASSSDQRPHFGLGPATKIEKIEVRWPSGHTEIIPPPAILDRFYVITEGKGIGPQK